MKCCVPKCSSRTDTIGSGLSFHRFPKDRSLKQQWKQAIGRSEDWSPTKWSVVCSLHFSPGHFRGVSGLRRLVKDAVPSLEPQEQTSGTAGPAVTVVVDSDGAERLLVPEAVTMEVVPSSIYILEKVDHQSPGESAAKDGSPFLANPGTHRKICHRRLLFFRMGCVPKTPVTATESTAVAEDSDCPASEMPPCEDRQAAPLRDTQDEDANVSSVAHPTAVSTGSPEDVVLCEASSPVCPVQSPSPRPDNESREASPSPSAHPSNLAATQPRHGTPAEREDTPQEAFLRSEVTRYSNLYRAGKKKIKGLQQCRRRLASKVARLQDVVKELKARVLDLELKAS